MFPGKQSPNHRLNFSDSLGGVTRWWNTRSRRSETLLVLSRCFTKTSLLTKQATVARKNLSSTKWIWVPSCWWPAGSRRRRGHGEGPPVIRDLNAVPLPWYVKYIFCYFQMGLKGRLISPWRKRWLCADILQCIIRQSWGGIFFLMWHFCHKFRQYI